MSTPAHPTTSKAIKSSGATLNDAKYHGAALDRKMEPIGTFSYRTNVCRLIAILEERRRCFAAARCRRNLDQLQGCCDTPANHNSAPGEPAPNFQVRHMFVVGDFSVKWPIPKCTLCSRQLQTLAAQLSPNIQTTTLGVVELLGLSGFQLASRLGGSL